MTKIRMTVENTAAVQQALRQYGEKAKVELSKAVTATAITVSNDIKRAIEGPPKTGRVYKRGNIVHRASAPGEAPANDTGTLASAIAFTTPNPLTAIVAVRADAASESGAKPLQYAKWLEFGTRNMRPRPAWRPAVEKNTPLFQRLIDAALRRAAQ